ncbi:site-2 protease family protein [bacterium]|nr:site-2 protease family protein [bacterium]
MSDPRIDVQVRAPWRTRPGLQLFLFLATLVSVYWATRPGNPLALFATPSSLESFVFACAVMAILLSHELGHYLAGLRHRVPMTLPFFIPVPFAIGTMGAVIRMKSLLGRAPLLDIGAAGPIAGMLVALPLAVAGIALSPVKALPAGANIVLGDSLLFSAIVSVVHGSIPEGSDVYLHPLGLAAWFGFLVTALNLMPAAQLDGGHIMKAAFGKRHAIISRGVFLSLAAWGGLGDLIPGGDARAAVTGAAYVAAAGFLAFAPSSTRRVGRGVLIGLFAAHISVTAYLGVESAGGPWLLWSMLLYLVNLDHPPVSDEGTPMARGRMLVAVLCLVLFVSTFTPVPVSITTS